MHIHKIQFENFKSFYSRTTINFDSMGGIWKVCGPIGSGKTTIGEAIIYGLYGKISNKSNKDLISWGEKHGLVELWCDSMNKSIYIKRELNLHGQSPLYVEVGGRPLDYSDKRDAQLQLNEYLDTTQQAMELLCIISFNSFKSLSTLNAKDTKLFLDQVIGMNLLTEYIDKSRVVLGDISSERAAEGKVMNVLQSQYESRLKAGDKVDNKVIVTLEKDIADLNEKLHEESAVLENGMAEVNKELEVVNAKITAVVTRGKAIAKDIKIIQSGICPVCHQEIPHGILPGKIKEKEELGRHYKEFNATKQTLLSNIQGLRNDMASRKSIIQSEIRRKEDALVKEKAKCIVQKMSDKELKDLASQIAECNQKIAGLDKREADVTTILNLLRTDTRQQIINQFIQPVNARIKEYSSMMFMGYTPEFDDQFKCHIKTPSLNDIPSSSLSTGQLKLVDMIIILSVVDTIVAGAGCNVIFLDELFSNLDHTTRGNLINVMQTTIRGDQTYFIVSHQDLDSEYIKGTCRLILNPNNNRMESRLEFSR